MKKIGKILTAICIGFIFLIGCENAQETHTETDGHQIQVVTSMFPMYELTKEVAGDRAHISLMVGPNEDAHHYEPSAQAVASVNEADIFVYSSDEMEYWVDSLLAVVENDDLKMVELGEGVDFTLENEAASEEGSNDSGQTDPHGHDHGVLDPHFWLNPMTVAEQLDLLVEALAEKDPMGSERYETNAHHFAEELQTLDQAYREAFQDAENRSFVVQHQAFGHLADQYDLNQVAVGGLTTEVEPDPKQLAEIVDFVNEQAVPVVYYQSGENSAIAETLADETGTEIGVLYDLEKAPSNFEAEDADYLDVMYENLDELKKSIH